jgi:hypothetical protein
MFCDCVVAAAAAAAAADDDDDDYDDDDVGVFEGDVAVTMMLITTMTITTQACRL